MNPTENKVEHAKQCHCFTCKANISAGVMSDEFSQRLDGYFKALYNIQKDYDFKYTRGAKYIKVTQESKNGHSKSVHSFIDNVTGDIYKPASWQTPAKHSRGNIFNSDFGAGALTAYGVIYLR